MEYFLILEAGMNSSGRSRVFNALFLDGIENVSVTSG